MMKNLRTLFVALLSCVVVLSSCSSDSDNDGTKSSTKSILEFTINSVIGTIDESNKTISITLPYGTDKTKLIPTIKVSDKASVDPKSGTETNFSQDVKYTVTAEDGSRQPYMVAVKIAEKSDKEITSFSFNELPGKPNGDIIQTNKTIKVTVPTGTNVTALKPTIQISGKEISPASEVAKDFTNPVEYIVTAVDGSKENYMVTVEVTGFNTTITNVDKTAVIFGSGESIVITGNFAESGNQVVLKDNTQNTELTITAQSTSSITATVPATLAIGSYTLVVTANGKAAEYTSKIKIVNTNAPRIISLDKAQYVHGIGSIIVTGINLKQSGSTSPIVYFRLIGDTRDYIGSDCILNADGTELKVGNSTELKVGKQKLYINSLDNGATNMVEFEILENTNPIPVILSIDKLNPTSEETVTITGRNFSNKEDTEIEIHKYDISKNKFMYNYSIMQPVISGNTMSFWLSGISGTRLKLKVIVKGKASDFYSSEIVIK